MLPQFFKNIKTKLHYQIQDQNNKLDCVSILTVINYICYLDYIKFTCFRI